MDISIVIPTLNRAASLKSTLLSLAAQQSSRHNFEVIVVDNGSDDATREVCRQTGSQLKNFAYCYDAEPGQLTGRHKGAELASGAILSFIDDDVELNPRWIDAVGDAFSRLPQVSIVTGPCLPRYQQYPPGWLQHFWQPTPYGGKMCLPLSLLDIGEDDRTIDPLYAFGLNYSIRKTAFGELGGFHPDCVPGSWQQFQGDGETGLSIKAKNKNYSAIYVSSALLYHLVSPERLQAAYFDKWYFYNGVCKSFSDIRLQHSLYHSYEEPPSGSQLLSIRIVRRVKNLISRFRNPAVPDQITSLRRRFDKKYREGYNFHRQAFLTDKKVRDWVLKPDYWNYKLPT